MYKDLEINEERLNSNPIIKAIAGEDEFANIVEENIDFNHDEQIRPIDTF